MRIGFILTLLLALPAIVFGDAGDGDFMGYTLGSDYSDGGNTSPQSTTDGNLIITAENPVKPGDIEEVSLVVTAETRTIGYIDASQWFKSEEEARELGRHYADLLRAKYPDWQFGRERMNNELRIVEVNFESPPHNIRLQLNQDERDGKNLWRFSMTLGWLASATEAEDWRKLSRSQHVTAQKMGRDKLLENADIRGL